MQVHPEILGCRHSMGSWNADIALIGCRKNVGQDVDTSLDHRMLIHP